MYCTIEEWARVIDLKHDTRHLCTHFRTDGIKTMSRGISGGKKVMKFANTGNHSRVCLLSQDRATVLVLQNAQFEFRLLLRQYCSL